VSGKGILRVASCQNQERSFPGDSLISATVDRDVEVGRQGVEKRRCSGRRSEENGISFVLSDPKVSLSDSTSQRLYPGPADLAYPSCG
jgi:hypothetical protein